MTSASPIVVTVAPSSGHSYRSMLYDVLYTSRRTYWLTRLAFAVAASFLCRASFGLACGVASSDLHAYGALLLVLPILWFVIPLLRLVAPEPHTVTFHEEGLVVESATATLSVAWSAVRAVRRTPWDLLVVLDGATINVPLADLEPGTADAVFASLRAFSRGSVANVHEAAIAVAVPYRTPESPPADAEATPQEWVAPTGYRESVLAFPDAGDHVRAVLMLRRADGLVPGLLLVVGALLFVLGTVEEGSGRGSLVFFTNIGAVVAFLGLASLVVDVLPALLSLGDRAVRERRAGVLYAVGSSGLYVRSASFERRESWARVHRLHARGERVAISAGGGIDVIPNVAFPGDADRVRFVNVVDREKPGRVHR